MEVFPNSEVRLLRGCKIDPDYDNTAYFSNRTFQENYFEDLVVKRFSNLTYQRHTKDSITVQASIGEIYGCNYMMFKNISFENKWFYAFIKDIEYVNTITSRVYYEIDVIQTWLFDFKDNFEPTFIEREHSTVDYIGANFVEEGLELGEYTHSKAFPKNSASADPTFTDFKICVLASVDTVGLNAFGLFYEAVYSGLRFLVFDTASAVNSFLDTITTANKADAVVAIFMVPTIFANKLRTGTDVGVTPGVTDDVIVSYDPLNTFGIFGDYTPKNNKLYCMPYCGLLLTNNEGQTVTLGMQYRNGITDYNPVNPDFRLYLSCSGVNTLEYSFTPMNYGGALQNHLLRLVISGSPMCSYNIDTYRAWLAQNRATLAVDTAFGAGNAIANFASGDIGGGVSALRSIANSLATVYTKSTEPPTVKGNVSSGALNINNGIFGFTAYHVAITPQYARIIDDYFSMFGYATKRVKLPNLTGRPNWNYVKTLNCCVHGDMPSDVTKKINSIFDNGIRFWQDATNIGDYSLNNSPVGAG